MGNCVTCKRVSAEIDETPKEQEANERKVSSKTDRKAIGDDTAKKTTRTEKKTVRFKLDDEDNNGGGGGGELKGVGAVRIRVVVTQKELIQILSNQSKYSSAEQLLAAMKLKSRKISSEQDDVKRPNLGGGWRPALESIPEDQHLSHVNKTD